MKQITGDNVAMEVVDGKLHIEIDLSKDLGVSKSGATHLVAKSGFAAVPNMPGFGFTLNAWRPKPSTAAK